jgi:putative ABC transport system permease protein
MAHTQDQFVMVNVKAVDEHFPLRGKLEINQGFNQSNKGRLVKPRAIDLLKVKVGDQVAIADGQFKVTGIIEHDSIRIRLFWFFTNCDYSSSGYCQNQCCSSGKPY